MAIGLGSLLGAGAGAMNTLGQMYGQRPNMQIGVPAKGAMADPRVGMMQDQVMQRALAQQQNPQMQQMIQQRAAQQQAMMQNPQVQQLMQQRAALGAMQQADPTGMAMAQLRQRGAGLGAMLGGMNQLAQMYGRR